MKRCSKENILLVMFCGVVCAAYYSWAMYSRAITVRGDFWVHSIVAESIYNGEKLPPHPLYFMIVSCLANLLSMKYIYASVLTVFLAILFTYIFYFNSLIEKKQCNVGAGILAICLIFINPIPLMYPIDNHYYFGYLYQNTFHSATQILMKLFSIMQFVFVAAALRDGFIRPKKLITILILTAFTMASKPSYIIAFLPAFTVLIMWKFFFKKNNFRKLIGWTPLILFILLALYFQYSYFYDSSRPGNKIELSFLTVYLSTSSIWVLLPKLILSLPLVFFCCIFNFKKMYEDVEFQLAGLIFGFSIIYAYFFSESVAGNSSAGNFWWSVQISTSILNFVCARSLVVCKSDAPAKKWYCAIWAVIFSQFISGFLFSLMNMRPGFLGLKF